MIFGLFLTKKLQFLLRFFNLLLTALSGDKNAETLLIIWMVLFRILIYVSVSNFFKLLSMFFISSITIFSLLKKNSEKFSPCCNKHLTSSGIVVVEKLMIQLSLMEYNEESGTVESMNSAACFGAEAIMGEPTPLQETSKFKTVPPDQSNNIEWVQLTDFFVLLVSQMIFCGFYLFCVEILKKDYILVF